MARTCGSWHRRAAEREAQEDLRCGGDDVVDLIEPILLRVGRLVVPRAQPEEAGGNEGVGRGVGKLVAGDLLDQEAVVRLIVVECADDPIAIAPGAGLGRVSLESVGFRESDEIEPVSRPALAVMGAGEQLIDDPVERLGRRVAEECLLLLGRRRQARQVEVESPQQGQGCGGRRRRPTLLLELRQDEAIDRVAAPPSRPPPPGRAAARPAGTPSGRGPRA